MESSINNNGEKELDIKKQFLTQEIINRGYNTNDFLNFCLTKKQNGDDLENWPLEELKECVKDFQQKNNNDEKSTSMKSFLFTNTSQNNNNNYYPNQNYLQSNQINQRINENIQNVNIGSQGDNYNNSPKIYKKK